MRATAFCPGHVTGFFQICEHQDLLSMGSRGAGMCLTLGATSAVSLDQAKRPSIEILLDGRRSGAEVTRTALEYLIGDDELAVKVRTSLDLPQSQGFGMSAAGALSASLAAAKLLGKGKQKAFEAAHIAEIKCRSGLGDVSAIHKGGITIRVRPGLPPRGKVLRIRGQPEVVLCVVGGRLLTRSIMSDPVKRRVIISSGSRRVDELVEEPSLDNLMRLSREFALESELASRRVVAAMSAAEKLGQASMAMLGNSVFAIGGIDGLAEVLNGFGPTYRCKVDAAGPRMVDL